MLRDDSRRFSKMISGGPATRRSPDLSTAHDVDELAPFFSMSRTRDAQPGSMPRIQGWTGHCPAL